MSDEPELPDERTVTTSSGEDVTVRETVTEVSVSASRKVQLDQYEPITAHTSVTAEKPSELDGIDSDCRLSQDAFDEWLQALADIVWSETERAVMRRHEEYIREDIVQ